MNIFHFSVCVLGATVVATSCGGQERNISVAPTAPSSNLASVPPRAPITFELTGIVSDQNGSPVPGAKVSVLLGYDEVASGFTDSAGAYRLSFTAAPGDNHFPMDPSGTEDAVAFAQVERAGYERYIRYIVGTAPHLVENIRLERINLITPGDATVLSFAPDDTVCWSDVWPGRELICEIVHVLAPSDGTFTVRARGTGPSSPTLEVYARDGGGGTHGNPSTLRVTSGIEYIMVVGIPWGTSDSVQLTTALAPP
jgi:hypothetical protein